MNGNSRGASCGTIYFDSFWVEYVSKEIKKFIGHKIIIKNICRIQSYDSRMCGHFSIDLLFYVKRQKFVRLYRFIFC